MANEQSRENRSLTQSLLIQKPRIQPKYDVHREVLTHEVVIKETGYSARDKSIPYALRQCWTQWSFLALFTGILPILQWLPKYSLRRDFMGDLIAGFTVAIMHIPHGMAYGLLAGVSAGNGMYMAIFPVLVYIVLGTSKHISIGTFSVISMMTLKVVQTYATDNSGSINATDSANTTAYNDSNSNGESDDDMRYMPTENIVTPLEVVTSLALTVGLVHFIMGMFCLGTLSSLLSDPLVNGFTTGAACHVVAAQLKEVLGVSVPRYKGAFKIVYTIVDLFKSLPRTNVIALIFCLGIMVFMIICNELLKPWLRKYCRMPFPAELLAVIGGTLVSKYLHVNEEHAVTLVGVIPRGLPAPQMPRLELVPDLIVDSIAIAVVSFSIVMSMGLTFAKKHGYEVRANQELFAMGMGNVVGGCFACIPLACSLSRSVIQDQTGGATQFASLIAAGLIVITLLWAGPFFSDLPRCVLAAVIIVALKPMFMQATELKKFSKQGKLELLTWICTFFSVVIIDIDIGLLIGVIISLLTLYVKGLKPYSCLLGTLPEATAIYVDINHHRNAVEVPETRIFRYTGSINFATGRFYRNNLYTKLGLQQTNSSKKPPPKQQHAAYIPIQQNGGDPKTLAEDSSLAVVSTASRIASSDNFRILILDFSMLGHIDMSGCGIISEILRDMGLRTVRLLLAGPTDRVYDSLVHSMALGEGPFEIFPTLHDAVTYANACRAL